MSITSSSPDELLEMVNQIQVLRKSLGLPSDETETEPGTNIIAIEMNTSCPNIPSHPPPAYSPETLRPLIAAFAKAFKEDPTLTLGLKLAPFVYRKQQEDILDLIKEFTDEGGRNPIAFLTCTNTLGGCTMFLDQTVRDKNEDQTLRDFRGGEPAANGKSHQTYGSVDVRRTALPTAFGGLAGDAVHYLSLG
jgi:dihydroorotate dehydrogenase (fumarate)